MFHVKHSHHKEDTDMTRMSETQMQGWTREEAIKHAREAWAQRLGVSEDSVWEMAQPTIERIDEDGWDEDIDGDIDLAMEAWARDTWEGTPWE